MKGNIFKRILKGIVKFFRIFFKIILVIFIILLIAGTGVITYIGYNMYPKFMEAKEESYNKLMSIDSNTFRYLYDTVIYDDLGNVIAEINIGNYEYVKVENVSKWITEGYIAVEDRTFKTHNGLDYKAILRAAIDIVNNKGEITQGGSTITQQVIKNNLLTNEKTFERKLIEFFLAPELEKQVSKSDIMEFYLNTNAYGNNCYGIETASKYYFNKPSKDLTISEAALLVGMSNNPTQYNPITKAEKTKEKRNFVLGIMLEQGVITQQEHDDAVASDLNLQLIREARDKESYQVSYAIYGATLKLMEKAGFEFKYTFTDVTDYTEYMNRYYDKYNEISQSIRGGGYKIYTSLNTEKQNMLQEIVDRNLSKYKDKAEDGRYAMQGSATLVNNTTGYVEAIVGGRGTEDEFNRAFLGSRQPGSSIKPIIVYGPAYDTGKYFPSYKMEDKKEKNGPMNWDNKYLGYMSLREAMCRSVNTVATTLFQQLGADTGLEYLGKLRFTDLTYLDNGNNSLALGGFTNGVTTSEMSKAYATFVNYGEYTDNLCITKIEFQNKGVLYDGEINRVQVYEPDAAYMILDSLVANTKQLYGLSRKFAMKDIVSGGKSGTTNEQKDAWYCGVSKYYSLTVWAGYDNPKSTGMYGSSEPGDIWKEAMLKLHEGLPTRDFERPATITDKNINDKGQFVDHNTGKTDLYSQALVNKANKEKQELEEQQKMEQEIRLIAKIEEELSILEGYKPINIESVIYVEEETTKISKEIFELTNEVKQRTLLDKLSAILKGLEESLAPYKEELRLIEEEKERQYQEEISTIISRNIILLNKYSIRVQQDVEEVRALEEESLALNNKVTNLEVQNKYAESLLDIMTKLNKEISKFEKEQELERIRQEVIEIQNGIEGNLQILRHKTEWDTSIENICILVENGIIELDRRKVIHKYDDIYAEIKRVLDEYKKIYDQNNEVVNDDSIDAIIE